MRLSEPEMKVITIVLLIIAFVLGHEFGVSNVAAECRNQGGFTNGNLPNGQAENYNCQPDFDINLKLKGA